MGLDTVELVMEIEEAFGIEISDAEACRIETPRQLIDHVDARIGCPGSPALPGMRAFHQFRKACLEAGVGPRRQIAPTTRLEDLIPKPGRPRTWRRIARAWEFEPWPALESPTVVKVACSLVLLTAFVGWILVAVPRGWGSGIALLFFAALAILLLLLTPPFRSRFPAELETVRDLVIQCVDLRPVAFWVSSGGIDRAQIASTVKRITCHYCGPADYGEDAHFVRDLGLD